MTSDRVRLRGPSDFRSEPDSLIIWREEVLTDDSVQGNFTP